MARAEPLFDALTSACLSRDGLAATRELDAFATRHGVAAHDAEALSAQGPRLFVYRALVRNNVAKVAFRLLPRTRALLNEHAADAFDDALVAYLDARAIHAPLLRDVPGELVAFARDRWSTLPPWALEVASFELALFHADVSPPGPPPPPLDGGARLALAAPAALLRFTHSVHEVDASAPVVPTARPVQLAVSRDASDAVQVTPLSDDEARLLERLVSGLTFAEATAELVERAPARLGAVAELLGRLAERGVFGAPPE